MLLQMREKLAAATTHDAIEGTLNLSDSPLRHAVREVAPLHIARELSKCSLCLSVRRIHYAPTQLALCDVNADSQVMVSEASCSSLQHLQSVTLQKSCAVPRESAEDSLAFGRCDSVDKDGVGYCLRAYNNVRVIRRLEVFVNQKTEGFEADIWKMTLDNCAGLLILAAMSGGLQQVRRQ